MRASDLGQVTPGFDNAGPQAPEIAQVVIGIAAELATGCQSESDRQPPRTYLHNLRGLAAGALRPEANAAVAATLIKALLTTQDARV